MPPSKKRKTNHHNQQHQHNRPYPPSTTTNNHHKHAPHNTGATLSHEEIWDDSALLRSWDDAVREYEFYHSIHARGEDVDEVLRQAEQAEQETSIGQGYTQIQRQQDLGTQRDGPTRPRVPNNDSTDRIGKDRGSEMEGEGEEGEIPSNPSTPPTTHLHPLHPSNSETGPPLRPNHNIPSTSPSQTHPAPPSAPPHPSPSTDIPSAKLNPLNATTTTTTAPVPVPVPVPAPATSSTSTPTPDQTLDSIKMAYYWAGYYSGLYDGQQRKT